MAEPGSKSRSSARRDALLDVAAEMFFEHGYAATSIDAIIERAGGSKRNIYSQFGNKAGLLMAIVTDTADKAVQALAIERVAGQDLRELLTDFGERLIEVYMSATVVGVYRIIVTEAQRHPDLARGFYDEGPGRTAAQLALVLDAAAARGEIGPGNTALLAEHFVGMIRDNRHLQVVLGLRPPPSAAEMKRIVESVVALFLDGARAR